MEPLLAGGVPQLHAQALILDVHGFAHEIDAHGRLDNVGWTCSLPVKLSKMNRLMMEVLPTDWSPSSTILHFTVFPSILLFILN